MSDQDECECEEAPTTFCDLDVENNVWVEGVVDLAKGKRGICMLDTMTVDQVVYVLQRNPQARRDLPKVTSNRELRELATKVPLLSPDEPADVAQSRANRNPAGIPFYNQFGGRPPRGNQK